MKKQSLQKLEKLYMKNPKIFDYKFVKGIFSGGEFPECFNSKLDNYTAWNLHRKLRTSHFPILTATFMKYAAENGYIKDSNAERFLRSFQLHWFSDFEKKYFRDAHNALKKEWKPFNQF